MAEEATAAPGALVLGVRTIGTEAPLRSRMGNAVTRRLFAIPVGQPIADTQTGLRANLLQVHATAVGSFTVTLQVNGFNTALSCTVGTDCTSNAQVAIAAGDRVQFSVSGAVPQPFSTFLRCHSTSVEERRVATRE